MKVTPVQYSTQNNQTTSKNQTFKGSVNTYDVSALRQIPVFNDACIILAERIGRDTMPELQVNLVRMPVEEAKMVQIKAGEADVYATAPENIRFVTENNRSGVHKVIGFCVNWFENAQKIADDMYNTIKKVDLNSFLTL